MIAPFRSACNYSATNFTFYLVFSLSFRLLRQKLPLRRFSRRCRLLPPSPAEKSKTYRALNCGFCIDEPRKKRYTILRRCSSAAGCRGVAQLVARLLWEQEAASSSLATPIKQKHVDSMRVNVLFVLLIKLPVKIRMCAKTVHTARPLSEKTEQPFFFPPLLRDCEKPTSAVY